jgi:hypothetical protein
LGNGRSGVNTDEDCHHFAELKCPLINDHFVQSKPD